MPSSLALAPCGDELATLGDDELRRWRVDGGSVAPVARAPEVAWLRYSPDGRWLAAAPRPR